MNERITELMEEAGIYDFVVESMGINEEMEKFAELIVKECIQVGGPEDSYTDEWFKAKADSIQKIKQHFGVEE
jgi:GMP synthase-like glutamine amidotransferase